MSNCYCWHFFCNHISYPVELSLLQQLSSKNTLVLNFPRTNYIVPQKEYRGIRELQHVPSCVGVLKQGEKQVPQSSFLSFFPSFQISFFSWANCSSTWGICSGLLLGWLRFIPEEQTASTWGASCLQTLARQKGICLYPFQFALWKKLTQKPAVAHEHLGFELSNCRTSWQRIMR